MGAFTPIISSMSHSIMPQECQKHALSPLYNLGHFELILSEDFDHDVELPGTAFKALTKEEEHFVQKKS